MATRAENERLEQERANGSKKRKARAKKAAAQKATTRPKRKPHAESKATYALEPRSKKGTASRKSTRSSANRAKTDSSFNHREQQAGTGADSKARRDIARRSRVRGG